MGSDPPPSRVKLLLAFSAIYFLWGSTYLAIKVAITTIPPFLMAGTRFLAAGAVVYLLGSRGEKRWPTARQWRNAAVSGVLMFVLGNGGVTWSEQTVSPGVAALVVATLPAWLLLLDWIYGGRKGPRLVETLGIVLGLGGVAAMSTLGAIDPFGVGALLVASVGWAIGSLVTRYADLPASPIRTAGMQMLIGGAVLVGLGLAVGEGGRLNPAAVTPESVGGWVYLAAVAVVALPAYNWLLSVTSPALVGTYAFVNPVVAVLLDWAVTQQPPAVQTAAAGGAVVLGVALLVWSRWRANSKSEPKPVPTDVAG